MARLEALAPRIMAVVIVAWIAVMFAASVYKYETFGQGGDQVDFEQAIWNTVHGRIMEDSRFNFTGSVFGMDWMPMLLFFVPFYALIPSAHTLFFLQIVGSGLGAVPLYWLARDKLSSKVAGLAAGIAYLLYPTLLHTALNPFQVRLFALTLLLFAFYYFERGNWKLFTALALLAVLARTDVALVVGMFGFYGLITRRAWHYVLPPILIGFGYFALSTFVIVPSFAYTGSPAGTTGGGMQCWPCGNNPLLAYYGHLGATGPEIIKHIVTNPISTAQLIFTPEKIGYMLLMLLPLAFLPLLAPKPLVLALPILMLNLLSLRGAQYDYQHHYSLLLILGLMAAAIYGASNLQRLVSRRLHRDEVRKPPNLRGIYRGAIALTLWALILTLPYKNPAVRALLYPESPARVQAAKELIALVPPEAKVAASSKLAPRLLPRRYIYNFPPASYSPYNFGTHSAPGYVDLDYILVDPDASALDVGANNIDGKSGLDLLKTLPGWHVAAQKAGFYLYSRH